MPIFVPQELQVTFFWFVFHISLIDGIPHLHSMELQPVIGCDSNHEKKRSSRKEKWCENCLAILCFWEFAMHVQFAKDVVVPLLDAGGRLNPGSSKILTFAIWLGILLKINRWLYSVLIYHLIFRNACRVFFKSFYTHTKFFMRFKKYLNKIDL